MSYDETQALIKYKDDVGRQEFMDYIFPKYELLMTLKGKKEEVADMHVSGTTANGVVHVYTVEIKKRYNIDSSKYPTAVLEKMKYDAMKTVYPNRTLYYACLYEDCCMLFNLDLIERLKLKPHAFQYPKTNQTRKTIEKEIYDIPMEYGIKINKNEIPKMK